MSPSDEDGGALVALDPSGEQVRGNETTGNADGATADGSTSGGSTADGGTTAVGGPTADAATPDDVERLEGRRTTASALETVEFVARSANRLRTLEVLAEGPRTRSELPDAVGASRVTLRRILLDFEERGWVDSRGRTYAATPLGRMVVEAFADLLATTTAVDDLQPVMPWFPADALGVDLAWLADADVVTPGPGDPYAPLRLLTDGVRAAGSATLLTSQVTGWCDERVVRRVAGGELSLDLGLGGEALAAVRRDPAMVESTAELVDAENAATWVADGDVPVVALLDDRAAILVTDARGDVRGFVTSGDERVVGQVEAAVDRHRRGSCELDPELLDR